MSSLRKDAARKAVLTSYPSARGRNGAIFARSTVMARRRARLVRSIVIALLLLGSLVAGGWAWMRPVPVSVTASPADASIALRGDETSTSARGRLTVPGVRPGEYSVRVERKGFSAKTAKVTAARLRGAAVRVVLVPLPQPVCVTATPKNAVITITSAEKTIATGKGSVECQATSGELTVEITAPGRNPWKRTVFVDAPTSLSARLDLAGQVVHSVALAACTGAPKSVAVTPDGSQAWTAILNGPPSIEIFEPATGKRIGEVDLGKYGAVEVIFNRAGTRAYASQMETAKVFEIDTSAHEITRSFKTESAWTKVVALSADEKTLFAANWSGDDVSEIDLLSGKLRRRIRVADTPRGLWPTKDGTTLWVASFGTGALERVDLKSGKVTKVFSNRGGALRHLVADEKRQRLYASDMAKDCVWVTDMKTGETTRFAKVGHKPNTIDLSPAGRVLFVSNRGANNSKSYYIPGPEWGSIMLLDTDGARPLDGIVGGNQCTALDVSENGKLLVFSDFLDDRLRVYEVPGYAELARGGGGRYAQLAKDVRKK